MTYIEVLKYAESEHVEMDKAMDWDLTFLTRLSNSENLGNSLAFSQLPINI